MLHGPARTDLLREECLGDILNATARRCPEHPALIWGDRTLTYGELDATANRIAAACQARGATRGHVIGLFLPRGADLLLAQAGITKSGAAWLPFDAETPLARIQTCLQSAAAIGLVTCRAWLPRCAGLRVPIWAIEDLLTSTRETPSRSEPTPSDPAYVIYTSGSTGEPKGIVISHRSICHFLRSENEALGINSTDRVYQGFSAAFDMSFEEIWISYLVGATVWIAPPELVRDTETLAKTWQRERITVVHAVPTLLGMINDPLPTVRLLNLGGEACPEALVTRFARPGRKIFNTYGPTETAVSASVAELKAGEPVTIGRPLPNYTLLVVDEQRRPVPIGEPGELCISGPGLALGYLGRPELTAQRFVPNPVATSPADQRMYLTGDLARLEPSGAVQFLGRADGQVKIRGFRVELGEITSALSDQPGVTAAGTVVRKLGESEEIVAFYLPAKGATVTPEQLRKALAARLPAYMVPAHFEARQNLPRLTSGKVDLAALRNLPLEKPASAPADQAPPRTPEEAALYAALQPLFPGRRFWPEGDFFNDLGGHSLLVARLVSALRGEARYATLGLQDVYRERTLGGIARVMGEKCEQPQPDKMPERAPFSGSRRFVCGLAQAAVVPVFILLHVADWLAPFFTYHYYTGDEGDSIPLAVMYSLSVFVLAHLVKFGLAVLGKRLIAGDLRAGRFPLWSFTYFRWWLVERLYELPDLYLLAGSPWMPWFLRLLGAQVGRDVMVDAITCGAPSLLTLEDGVSLGSMVNIENARVEGGWLIIGPVHLGREAVVDSYSVLENDTRICAGARLCGQSALAAGREIPAGETWDGAPALKADRPAAPLPPRPAVGSLRRGVEALVFAVSAILVSVLFFLPVFPCFMLIDWLDANSWDVFDAELHPLAASGFLFLLAIPASAGLIFLTMLATAGLQRLLPAPTSGIVPVHSFAYWRKWLTTVILDCSLHTLHSLYASVFAPFWLRLLGARVGRHAEISTAQGIVPRFLTLGDDSFIADGVMLGDQDVRGGWMILKPTQIGNRSFVGNGSYVPDGAIVPDNVLIGVQTRSPDNAQLISGQTWMGSPPLLLPAREQLAGFPESLTFRPSTARRCGRGAVEAMRIVLPLAFVIAAGYLIVILVMPLAEEYGWGWQVATALSVAGCLYGLATFFAVVAIKWLLVRRYRPCAAPMWTPFVWFSEAVTNLYESLACPGLLDLLRGTPMLPWALRLLGARIGRGVFLNTTDLTEFDCVEIGDEAELNAWCGPQTHLFEDRVMKIGTVRIGKQVCVGVRSTILYDTSVADGVRLGPLTLVAKGEQLPAQTSWEGSPAAPKRGSSPAK